MAIYEIRYTVISSKIMTVRADSLEEAKEKYMNDDFIDSYEDDSDYHLTNIEEVAE